jgi:hypothetical protein
MGYINSPIIFSPRLKIWRFTISALSIFERNFATRYKTVVLNEVTVQPKDQKPGMMTMHVTLERDAGIVKCSVNDTPYMEVNISGKIKPFPEIEDYGFLGYAYKAKKDTTSIFKRIEVRGSK